MPLPSILRVALGVALVALAVPRAEPLLACTTCGCCRFEDDDDFLATGSSVGQVIVSEIMYNPAGTDRQDGPGGFNKEWIELYNTGDSVLNLGGWSVGNPLNNQWADPFPQRTFLFPGQAMVVTGDAVTFDNQWGQGIYRTEVGGFPVLTNSPTLTSGAVAIRDSTATIHDVVNYRDVSGWPRINGGNGASIFALPSGLSSTANDVGTNWAPSAWGAFGAVLSNFDGEINHASPGYVATEVQPPFTPSPDAAWSMVLLPDTQNYVKASSETGVLTTVTEWIRDNREAFNIHSVVHLGDIVNNNNTNNPSSGNQTSTQQWQHAQASMHVLNGEVPYILAAGNHDFGTTNAQNRQTFLNDYFKASDNPLIDPAQGGMLKGTMVEGELQNAYYEFTAPDGRKMLILSLEWEPRPATVNWANQVAAQPEFADHTAMLVTHAYLRGDDTRYTSSRVPGDASGLDLWAGLVRQHGNFELVASGHFGGDGQGYLESTALPGNTVHQLFFNTQFETQGGNGWIQVLEFLEDGTTVRVRTYSPYLNQMRTHPDHAFEFQLSPLIPFGGDFNESGFVEAADYTVWRDGLGSTYGPPDYDTWRANFGATAPPPPPPPPSPAPTLVYYRMAGIPNQPVASAAPTEVAEGITATHITRGPGIQPANLTNGFSANGWNRADPSRETALAGGDFFEFGFSVDEGFVASLSTLDLSLRRSAVASPRNFELQASLDGFATEGIVISEFSYFGRTSGNPPAIDPLLLEPFYYMDSDLPGRPNATTSLGDPIPTINLSLFSELQDLPEGTEITFRLYAWAHTTATTETNTLGLGRMVGPRLGGVVVAMSEAAQMPAAVPEPAGVVLAMIAACLLAGGRRIGGSNGRSARR